jgi:hypothetical protein
MRLKLGRFTGDGRFKVSLEDLTPQNKVRLKQTAVGLKLERWALSGHIRYKQ